RTASAHGNQTGSSVDAAFSEDQQQLQAAVRRFLDERAPMTYVRSMLDDARGTTDGVWAGLADLGITGMLIGTADGGSGGTMVDPGAALEELGRAVHPGPLLSTAVVGGSLATEPCRSRIAAGTCVAALAALEPGQRLVAPDARPATTVSPGSSLHGRKVMVPD